MIENISFLDKFLKAYWNETYDFQYSSIEDAVQDFADEEGKQAATELMIAFRSAKSSGVFPETISHDHSGLSPFWDDYRALLDVKQATDAIKYLLELR